MKIEKSIIIISLLIIAIMTGCGNVKAQDSDSQLNDHIIHVEVHHGGGFVSVDEEQPKPDITDYAVKKGEVIYNEKGWGTITVSKVDSDKITLKVDSDCLKAWNKESKSYEPEVAKHTTVAYGQTLELGTPDVLDADTIVLISYTSSTLISYTGDTDDNREFLMEEFGFSKQELENIDITAFVEKYNLRYTDYTAEQVHSTFDLVHDAYVLDGSEVIYDILDMEGTPFDESEEVKRMGYYVNSGTSVQRIVFDLDNNTLYINDVEPHLLSEEDVIELRSLPEKYSIQNWSQHTEGVELPSTGNYSWKIVFQTLDNTYHSYDGYTTDMSHLPDSYNDLHNYIKQLVDKSNTH